MFQEIFDVLVIGSGPSGLTAAIYCARANKSVGVVLGPEPGGQLMRTTDVENYPGFAHGVQGPDLMDAMFKQAENQGTKIIEGSVSGFVKEDELFFVSLEQGQKLRCRSLIIATGANAKLLGIEGDLWGRGISACATCDGAFFKNKVVAVIGGGNSALEESIYLSNIASKVYLIHRRTAFRGEAIMQQRVRDNAKIEILWPYEVAKFLGEKKLHTIQLRNTDNGELRSVDVDGAFVAIGHAPNTGFLNGLLELQDGYVKEGPNTFIPGLYVAGDVFDSRYRQAVTAAGYGCMAALEAVKYLEIVSIRD